LADEKTDEEIVMQEESILTPEPSFLQEADNAIMDCNASTEEFGKLESEQLDDLIDFGFSSKEKKDFNTAFSVFSKALTLYPDSQAAPFLVVEIGNILKNRGDYDAAIKVFSDGRNLAQIKQDEMIEQEFISTIAYLRIIKNVLLQNHAGNVPFLKIPPEIIGQIDEEFREWRSVSNI
jgi:tetratricopeptide (TPR) repeat protein